MGLLNNTEITEIENKIPRTSDLATNVALTTYESKVPDVSSLEKKQIMTQKLVKLKEKLITIMVNILLPQNLISFQQTFLMKD